MERWHGILGGRGVVRGSQTTLGTTIKERKEVAWEACRSTDHGRVQLPGKQRGRFKKVERWFETLGGWVEVLWPPWFKCQRKTGGGVGNYYRVKSTGRLLLLDLLEECCCVHLLGICCCRFVTMERWFGIWGKGVGVLEILCTFHLSKKERRH